MLVHCRIEIEKEVRVHVDELMREELKNLKLVTPLNWLITILTLCTNTQAVDRDKGTKKKKGKKKGKKVS